MPRIISIAPGVLVERVGADVIAIVPGESSAVTLSGHVAELLLQILEGKGVARSQPALEVLIDSGIVSVPGLPRRNLIRAGMLGAIAGVTVFPMPVAASASSIDNSGDGGSSEPATPRTGRLFRGGGWTLAENNNNPVIVAELNPPIVTNPDRTDLSFVRVDDPPYSTNPVPSPTLSGTVTVGGVDYTAFLVDYRDGSNVYRLSAWFFRGADSIATDDPFVLTFTVNGTPYSVSPAP